MVWPHLMAVFKGHSYYSFSSCGTYQSFKGRWEKIYDGWIYGMKKQLLLLILFSRVQVSQKNESNGIQNAGKMWTCSTCVIYWFKIIVSKTKLPNPKKEIKIEAVGLQHRPLKWCNFRLFASGKDHRHK